MNERFDSILVYADGACTGNPGPGGWGVIIVTPQGEVVELGGGEAETTNNKMELTAAGKALRHLEDTPGPVVIYTDSSYVIHGITRWVWGWRAKDWKTAEGKDVANAEFWKRLMAILGKRGKEHPVTWKYVKGHSGVPGNERADEIAVEFAKGRQPRLYRGSLLKYGVAVHDLPPDVPTPEPKARNDKPKEAYSYLSLVHGKAARHKTWGECQQRVNGVPNAKFKKCMSAEEEAEVLEKWGAKL